MSCRRAFELDPVEFLADPRSEGFREFVGHYPLCPECSAEIRAWTEIHARLADAGEVHPDPATLLRLQREPERLGAERERVAGHVARCRTCSEELSALRQFEAQPREIPLLSRDGWRVWTGLSRLRGLVLHPAFAYALVALLLIPTLRGQRLVTWGESSRREAPAAPAAEAKARRPVERPQPRERALRASRPAPAPSLAGRSNADEAQEVQAARKLRAAEDAPLRGLLSQVERPALARSIAPHFDAASGSLEVPLPRVLEPGTRVSVSLVSADGQRELRERRRLATRETVLRVELPPEWQRPGSYRVVVRIGAGEGARIWQQQLRIP